MSCDGDMRLFMRPTYRGKVHRQTIGYPPDGQLFLEHSVGSIRALQSHSSLGSLFQFEAVKRQSSLNKKRKFFTRTRRPRTLVTKGHDQTLLTLPLCPCVELRCVRCSFRRASCNGEEEQITNFQICGAAAVAYAVTS